MAACPVLGLAALLFLSAPQASSMVQYRQLVPVVLLEPQGRDCSHIWVESPRARSGVYTIQPEGASAPFKVLCDMRTDGGWTVIQSRDRGRRRPLDFERCWQEYKRGFGDLRGDHWLGLEHISGLTSQPGLRSELVVDLLDTDNHTLQAHYDNFHVDKEDQFYQLTLGLYSGNAGECWGGKEPLCLPPSVLLCPWALQAAGGGTLAAGQGRWGRLGPWSPLLSGPHLPASVLWGRLSLPIWGPRWQGRERGPEGQLARRPRHHTGAGDAFRGMGQTDNQEGCGFSTLDRDHDHCTPCTDRARTFTSCSHDRSGAGWWYSACGHADLNGPWPEHAGAASGMRWAAGDHQPALRASVLRVRTTASRKA
ncbi:uncharacterized protein LOC123843126 [Mirounga angustirostris]|uniref:uncharacterized protein LOC123843126 n=1 Tax=Mirounga angustirostris TaxID=9716 RepID=UPI0023E3CAAC|nr:uncharacterized protein LOC123843126 isoform X1 [Mirounga angustirostris]